MSSSNKRNGVIVFGVVGLICAFFFPYSKISRPEEKASKPVTASARKSPSAPEQAGSAPGIELASEPLSSANTIRKRKDEYNSIVTNRLKEIQTSDQGATLSLNIRTKAEPKSCQSGDFDIIKSLIADADEKVFVLSVEKLGSGAAPTSARLNLLDIMKGDLHAFTVPKLDSAQEYGIYLCLDPKKTGSCSKKAPLAAKDWNAALGKTHLPENILYYQLITTNQTKAYVVPIDRWGPEVLEEMKGRLKMWLRTPDESLEKTASLMSRLGTLPAEVTEGNVEIPLPYRDPKCDVKASVKPLQRKGGG